MPFCTHCKKTYRTTLSKHLTNSIKCKKLHKLKGRSNHSYVSFSIEKKASDNNGNNDVPKYIHTNNQPQDDNHPLSESTIYQCLEADKSTKILSSNNFKSNRIQTRSMMSFSRITPRKNTKLYSSLSNILFTTEPQNNEEMSDSSSTGSMSDQSTNSSFGIDDDELSDLANDILCDHGLIENGIPIPPPFLQIPEPSIANATGNCSSSNTNDMPIQNEVKDEEANNIPFPDGVQFQHKNPPIGTRFHSPIIDQVRKKMAMPNHLRVMAELYKLCDDSGGSRGLLDKVIKIIRKESNESNFDILSSEIKQRPSIMKSISKYNKMPPNHTYQLTLESGLKASVQVMPVHYQMQEHFIGQTYSDFDKICCDPKDPFSCKPLPDLYPDEIIGTQWYIDSYNEIETELQHSGEDINNYHIEPFIIYMDGTEKSLRNLMPVVMCSGILRTEVREDSSLWDSLGIVPDLTAKSQAKFKNIRKRKNSKHFTIRDYHRVLSVLFDPLQKLMETRPIFLFRRGDKVMYKRIIPIVAFEMADHKEGDSMCARISDKGPSSKRMTKKCFTDFKDACKSKHDCTPVDGKFIDYLSSCSLGCTYGFFESPEEKAEEVSNLIKSRTGNSNHQIINSKTPKISEIRIPCIPLSTNLESWCNFLESAPSSKVKKQYIAARKLREKLCHDILTKALGSKVVDNAFSYLDHGADKNGVHEDTLPDIMHTLESGIFPKLLEVIFGQMSDKHLEMIDAYAEELWGTYVNRSGEKNIIYRVSFRGGFTKRTKLTAKERVGQMLILAKMLQTGEGRRLLFPRFELDFDQKHGNNLSKFNSGDESDDEHEDVEEFACNDGDFNNELNDDDDDNQDDDDYNGQEKESARLPITQIKSQDSFKNHWDSIIKNQQPKSVSEILECLDLKPVAEKLKYLPKKQQEIIDTVIRDTVSEAKMKSLKEVQIPHGILNYRNMKDPYNKQSNVFKEGDFRVLVPNFEVNKNREHCSLRLTMDQLSYVIEGLLSFHSLLKYGGEHLRTRNQRNKARAELELLRRVIVKGFRRGEGTREFSFQKWIEMSHFIDAVSRYGKASSFDTHGCERGLKDWAKKPASTSQKRSNEIFTTQVALRAREMIILNSIIKNHQFLQNYERQQASEQNNNPLIFAQEDNQSICETDKLSSNLEGFTGGIVMSITHERRTCHSYSCNHSKIDDIKESKTAIHFPPEVVDWFWQKYKPDSKDAVVHINIFSEIKQKGGNIVRAHPNYKFNIDDPWNDYISVRYDVQDNENFPAKLMCIYQDPNKTNKSGNVLPTDILVQEVIEQDTYQIKSDSLLFRHWTMSSKDDFLNRPGKRQKRLEKDKAIQAVFSSFSIDTIEYRRYCFEVHPKSGYTVNLQNKFRMIEVRIVKEEWPERFFICSEFLKEYKFQNKYFQADNKLSLRLEELTSMEQTEKKIQKEMDFLLERLAKQINP